MAATKSAPGTKSTRVTLYERRTPAADEMEGYLTLTYDVDERRMNVLIDRVGLQEAERVVQRAATIFTHDPEIDELTYDVFGHKVLFKLEELT